MYCLSRQHNMPLCTGLDGSDGTRTRDLRRDRPNRAPRRSSMDIAEQLHLQVLLARRLPLLRVVEPILESTFGPRMGHGIFVKRDYAAEPACASGTATTRLP